MKVKNFEFQSADLEQIADAFSDFSAKQLLIQVFTGLKQEQIVSQILHSLSDHFPDTPIIGASTVGEICNGEVSVETTVVSIIAFEHAEVATYGSDSADLQAIGNIARQQLITPTTKALICFSAGLAANPSIALDQLLQERSDIILAGGISGDNYQLTENWVFHQKQIFKSGLVIAAISSEQLSVENALKFNWEPIGEELTITKAEQNVIYTINDIPLVELYNYYFGQRVGTSLPGSSSMFPLTQVKDGIITSKVFLQTGEHGSGIFTGEFTVGDKVRFAYANPKMLLDNSYLKSCFTKQAEVLFIYSCGGRKYILQEQITAEIEPLVNIAPSAGFFTYGEFYTTPSGNPEILNNTMTLLTFSEQPQSFSLPEDTYSDKRSALQFSTEEFVHSLIHFTRVITKELSSTNNQLKEKSVKLEKLNITDPLTGIANRRRFEDYFSQIYSLSLRVPDHLSLLILDIDYFKQYNDNYGHAEGDQCLKVIAQTLDATLSRDNDFVARYGGEEFVVVLPNTDEQTAKMLGEKLRHAVEQKSLEHSFSKVAKVVTISVGVATKFPDDTRSKSDLFKQCDDALYTAKHQGRNQVISSTARLKNQ